MRSLISGLLLACLFTSAQADEASLLNQVIEGKHRSAENKARDRFRHPEQTLAFFDVKEDMTVVEIWPGAGWYTEILAPYLKDKGKLYAAHFSKDSKVPYFRNSLRQFVEKIKAQPDVYGKLELTVLQPPESVQIAPDASADRVLTFRNVHNWMNAGQAKAVFAAMYKALKPGGILGAPWLQNQDSRSSRPRLRPASSPPQLRLQTSVARRSRGSKQY